MEKERMVRLVAAAQNGDAQALNELFDAFYNDVYYFALKTVKDETLACDITQESFVDMINGLSTLQEPAAFAKWMKQITYRQCTRYFRKKKDVLADEDEDGKTFFDIVAEDRTEFIPDEALDQQDFRRTLLAMLDELSEEQRSATLLYYYDELSVKQIAEIQGVSEGTVKSRLNYARKSIKNSIETYEKKNDVKLHSFAFLPLMFWLLKSTLEESKATAAASLPAVASGISAATGATLVASTSGVAATVAATTGTVATGVVATGITAKIVAGCLALAVAIGGAVAYLHEEDPTEPTQQTSATVALEIVGTTLPEISEPTMPQISLNDLAMEAYDDLLRRGYTDNAMPIYYYTHLDINHDGVSELIVADNNGTPDAWTVCELYTYDETGLVFCGSTNSRYDYLYYVNGEFLVGKHRMGDQYLSTAGFIDFNSSIETCEIIELQETPYTAVDIGITKTEILQIFYRAKNFYDVHINGKRFLDSVYYSAGDFDWIEGVIEYNGGLYSPCNEYTYDEFVQELQSLFTSDVANALIEEVGLLEYNEKCYTYIREGVGDIAQGDYEALVQLKGNMIFEIRVSFTALDSSSITEYIYCQKENDAWVIDSANFYGE